MYRYSARSKRRRGVSPAFTLIELLVVISIIALLISILLPSLQKAREQAKLTKCISSMKAISSAAFVFAAEHSNRFQVATDEVGLARADSTRQKFEYGAEKELLSWPVALAQSAGIEYENNWDWGVRAVTFQEARDKQNLMERAEMFLCPSDKVQISTPFYPRNKPGSLNGINNDGLRGQGDPADPMSSASDMAYWGYLSYGLNEDVAGVEVAESNNRPACWRAVPGPNGYQECIGEFTYPRSSPCGSSNDGWRLQGDLDRVFMPGAVGLVFEAGRDDETQTTGFTNLIISAGADGPYLEDFQQRHQTRLPESRHPKGRTNVLFADGHGGNVVPVEFDSITRLPTKYSDFVRVSPYQVFGTGP